VGWLGFASSASVSPAEVWSASSEGPCLRLSDLSPSPPAPYVCACMCARTSATGGRATSSCGRLNRSRRASRTWWCVSSVGWIETRCVSAAACHRFDWRLQLTFTHARMPTHARTHARTPTHAPTTHNQDMGNHENAYQFSHYTERFRNMPVSDWAEPIWTYNGPAPNNWCVRACNVNRGPPTPSRPALAVSLGSAHRACIASSTDRSVGHPVKPISQQVVLLQPRPRAPRRHLHGGLRLCTCVQSFRIH
jgi:hypothetical protein